MKHIRKFQTSLQPWKWDSLKTLVNSEIQITLTSKFCTKHNQVQPQTWFKRYRWYKVILNFRSLDLYNMQIPGAILWTSHPSILKIHVLEQLDIRWQCILSGKQGRIYFHIALEWFLFYFSSRSVKMAHKRNSQNDFFAIHLNFIFSRQKFVWHIVGPEFSTICPAKLWF